DPDAAGHGDGELAVGVVVALVLEDHAGVEAVGAADRAGDAGVVGRGGEPEVARVVGVDDDEHAGLGAGVGGGGDVEGLGQVGPAADGEGADADVALDGDVAVLVDGDSVDGSAAEGGGGRHDDGAVSGADARGAAVGVDDAVDAGGVGVVVVAHVDAIAE